MYRAKGVFGSAMVLGKGSKIHVLAIMLLEWVVDIPPHWNML